MIPYVVGVHLLLGRVDFGIAMDDHISGCLFRKDFRIDVGDAFIKDNRYINEAFPCLSFRVFQICRRNRTIKESFFSVVHDLQLIREALKIMLYPVSRPHCDEIFLSAPAADQRIDPVRRKIGDFAPIHMGFRICENGIKSADDTAMVKRCWLLLFPIHVNPLPLNCMYFFNKPAFHEKCLYYMKENTIKQDLKTTVFPV